MRAPTIFSLMDFTFNMNASQMQDYVQTRNVKDALLTFHYGGTITIEFNLDTGKEEFDIPEDDALEVQLILADQRFYTEVFEG